MSVIHSQVQRYQHAHLRTNKTLVEERLKIQSEKFNRNIGLENWYIITKIVEECEADTDIICEEILNYTYVKYSVLPPVWLFKRLLDLSSGDMPLETFERFFATFYQQTKGGYCELEDFVLLFKGRGDFSWAFFGKMNVMMGEWGMTRREIQMIKSHGIGKCTL